MKRVIVFVLLLAGAMLSAPGCEDESSSTRVRFQNNSQSRTVYAVWDGARTSDLAPGQTSSYSDANSGTHTIQWKNAADNDVLTSIAWPNLVDGQAYTFPYND